jgi:secondary thiamine-phosphate synthase enzyme
VIHLESLDIRTQGRGLTDITAEVRRVVSQAGLESGLCIVFVRHTSASLVIQENADPSLLRDMQRWMAEYISESRKWEHDDEGPDDMPAHMRSALTKTSESIPVSAGRLLLGTWQAIYLWEHRSHPHRREVLVQCIG